MAAIATAIRAIPCCPKRLPATARARKVGTRVAKTVDMRIHGERIRSSRAIPRSRRNSAGKSRLDLIVGVDKQSRDAHWKWTLHLGGVSATEVGRARRPPLMQTRWESGNEKSRRR